MAMTAAVKDELAHLTVTKPCCRKAEVSSILRFAGGLHLVSGRVVVEAELDAGATARRVRRDIAEVYGHASDVAVVAPGGLRKGSRYVVRVARDGEALARQTGLSRRRLEAALETLARENWAYTDGVVLWVRNGLRHDPQVRLSDAKHRKAVEKQLDGLPHSSLVAKFCTYYQIARAFDGPPETIPALALREGEGEGDRYREGEGEGGGSGGCTPPSGAPAAAPTDSAGTEVRTANGLPIPATIAERIPSLLRWPAPEALAGLWNWHAREAGLAQVETLSERRKDKARRLIRQQPDWRWWNGTLSKIQGSRFLTGQVPPANGHTKSFRADFDWLLACARDGTENAVKLHDGRYDG